MASCGPAGAIGHLVARIGRVALRAGRRRKALPFLTLGSLPCHSKPRRPLGAIIPETVNTMWGTDLTTTLTGEGQVAVFVAVDHCSAECVGIHAARRATRFEALEPIRQGMRRCFGAFAKEIARGLAVRHDHGSQYRSDAFQRELAFLGIASSPAFVRAPEGNGCAERFIRTLKENLLWVRTFDTVEELRQALLVFRAVYNTTWLIERHGFQTPAAVRQSQLSPAAMAASHQSGASQTGGTTVPPGIRLAAGFRLERYPFGECEVPDHKISYNL